MTPVYIDYLRSVITLCMLGYAAYKDLKTREIYDIVWVIPAAFGLIIDIYEVYTGNLTVTQAGISIGFMVILSGALWFLQLFGEADLIAFVTLAVLHPRTPDFGFIGYTPILFSFTLVANSALSGLLIAFYILSKNMRKQAMGINMFERYAEASTLRKFGLLFTGKYMRMNNVKGPPYEYPLEVEGELILKPNIWDDEKAKNDFRIAREKGYDRMWVSTTLPYIVNLLVGYIISVVYGDIMFSIMSRLM